MLTTKLLPPEVKAQTLPRPRLCSLLDKNRSKRIMVLAAPPGYGKTTLLGLWCATHRIPCVWYRLDPSDAHPDAFLNYTVAGVGRRYPRFGHRMAKLLSSSQSDPLVWAGFFLNAFQQSVRQPLYLILDDFQNLEPGIDVFPLIDYLIRHAPRNLHFIIATRHVSGLPFEQYSMRGDVFFMTGDDLRFTTQEIREFVQRRLTRPLSRENLELLIRHSEGWPASLELMMQATGLRLADRITALKGRWAGKAIEERQADYFKFFAREIYQRESPAARKFLAACSVLEWLHPDACAYLTGRRDAAALLKEIENRNDFVQHLPDNTFRLHNLFRDFLRSRLPAATARKYLTRAGRYFTGLHQSQVALRYFLEAGDHNSSAAIIRDIGRTMILQGKSRLLLSQLAQLPGSIINRNPELLDLRGYARVILGDAANGRQDLERAVRLFRQQHASGIKYAEALYDLGFVHYSAGEVPRALALLQHAMRILAETGTLTEAAILNALGIIYSKIGGDKLNEASRSFERSHVIVERHPQNQGLAASILNNWAMVERKAGNLQQAWDRSRQAVELLKSESNYSPQCGIIFFNAACFALYQDERRPAFAILRRGEHLSRHFQDELSQAAIVMGDGIYHEETGDPGRGRRCLVQVLAAFEHLKNNRMILAASQHLARINMTLGRLDDAVEYIRRVWQIRKRRDDAEAVAPLIIEAQLKARQNDRESAERILIQCADLAHHYHLDFEEFMAWRELAALTIQRGNVSMEMIERLVQLSRDRHYDRFLSAGLVAEPRLAEHLLRVDRTYALRVMRMSNLPVHIIEVSLFGRPRVSVNGLRLNPPDWPTIKAFKLFCYMARSRKQEFGRDLLIEVMWPESKPAAGMLNLRKAVQHIRQTFHLRGRVRSNPVLYQNDQYRLTDTFLIALDIEEFDRLLNRAKQSAGDPAAQQAYLTEAVDMYQDGLATGWYDEWLQQPRQWYRERYEECLRRLAESLLVSGAPEQAAERLKQLVDSAFLEENHHCRLWQIWRSLNKIKEIREDYRALAAALKKEFGTSPRPETATLFHSLTK